MEILRIEYQNINVFKEGLIVDFTTKDRVFEYSPVTKIYNTIHTNNVICLVGINASGKSVALRLMNAAMQVILENKGLNELNFAPGIIKDGTILTIDFYVNENFYRLTSEIKIENLNNRLEYYFNDEKIYNKSKSEIKNRKELFDYSKKDPIYHRTDFEQNKLSLLKKYDSIISIITKDFYRPLLINFLSETNHNMYMIPGKAKMEIINLFDDSIKELTKKEYSINVTFKNNSKYISDDFGEDLLSSGTIRGGNLLYYVKLVLNAGGILVIDELENHMNKRLIEIIIDLFEDKDINKKGATLLFSTHYVEILETIDRKDNIYLMLRGDDYVSRAVRYADKVSRNDVKKSDILLSNYINGTSPKYENVEKLREFMCKSMSEGESSGEE